MSIDIEDFYRKYGPMVLRRCRFLLRNEEKALDAMQDTFVKLLRYQDTLKADYPSSLLMRIATNICLNTIQRDKRNPETADESALSAIVSRDNLQENLEVKDLLEMVLKKEKISTREIALLYYVDQLTLEQVAEEVGLSVSGVRKRLRNLRINAKNFAEAIL